MIQNYNVFREDKILESLLLESKLEFSKRFANLIGSMPESKLKNDIINLSTNDKDLTISQNFFDIGDSKEEVTFIPDKKAQQILGDTPVQYITDNSIRNHYLTFNQKDGKYTNRVIFKSLGFDPETTSKEKPSGGLVGVILAETPSKKTPGKVYALFKWDNGTCVVDKNHIYPHDDRLDRVWKLSKSQIRIGRAIKAILTSAGISATDKEIEDFVNAYKSSYDIMNDAFLKFDVVEGDKIAYWYNNRHYENDRSTLGSSCMSDVNDDFFDLYVMNPDVCKLVILYSEKGKVVDGKWKSLTIRGRALLWKTTSGDMFMDRIYYNYESDVSLFKQYAEKNDWWCKTSQDSSSDFTAQKGTKTKDPTYTVQLKKSRFDSYPYVDTMSYISFDEKTISNDSYRSDASMMDTDGSYDSR